MVVAGCLWLLMVLYCVGWLWPIPDCSGRLWPDLVILFSSTGVTRCCLMVLARSRWFLLVQNSCCCCWIVLVAHIWPLMLLYGGCWLLPVPDGVGRYLHDLWIIFSSSCLI